MTDHHRVLVARLWIEGTRRLLGRPTMSDDDFERLGHDAVADDHYPDSEVIPDGNLSGPPPEPAGPQGRLPEVVEGGRQR
jgi:hypothetical protein